jgi:hypothetical protein
MVPVPLMSLWLPILVSAVLVFIASSIIHMVLGYHRADYKKVPAEDQYMDAVRGFNLAPGDYMVPCAGSSKEMNAPAFQEKWKRGPVMVMTVLPAGQNFMGAQLAQWFVFIVVVSIFAAYVAGRAVGPAAPYLDVFRFSGVTAFVGYSLAHWPQTIWYRRSLGTTVRNTFDGLVYGLLTAGAFGWLWPK